MTFSSVTTCKYSTLSQRAGSYQSCNNIGMEIQRLRVQYLQRPQRRLSIHSLEGSEKKWAATVGVRNTPTLHLWYCTSGRGPLKRISVPPYEPSLWLERSLERTLTLSQRHLTCVIFITGHHYRTRIYIEITMSELSDTMIFFNVFMQITSNVEWVIWKESL